jgi:hypothetical protein
MIPDLRDTILNTWRTNNRVTLFLVERIPPELWASADGLWQWTKRAAEAGVVRRPRQ